MSGCPVHHAGRQARPELPPMPPRIAALPLDDRGYPIPFFVAYIDGKPDFRVADPDKVVACVKCRLCWVCGQGLGRNLAFPIGPMCTVNRTTAEPPSHRDCALWSAIACPFLSRPHAHRREDELTEANAGNVAGEMIKRNPGVTAVWVTRSYELFPDGTGKVLFEVGPPVEVTWWREGRRATRTEVMEAIESGIPLLRAVCQNPTEVLELARCTGRAMQYLPAEVPA